MQNFLEGIRVLELGSFISGPYAGQLLAEMGADVTKIEKPGSGDPFRGFSSGTLSPQFCAYNRGKRSVTLDVNASAGLDVLLRLVEKADVLLDNFRPEVAGRLGFGYEVLHRRNPSLIYCNLSGFGPTGPCAKRPAYDTVALSMSGFLSQLLDPEDPRIVGPAMADAISGLYMALAIVASLTRRSKDGKGHRIDVAMVEAMAAFATEPFAKFFARGTQPGPYDRAAASQSFALKCADGKLIGLHLSSPQKFWDALMAAVDAPDIAGDPRFSGRAERVANYKALRDALAREFMRRPRAEWEQRLNEHDVPHAPIYSFKEVTEDRQINHLGTIYSINHQKHGDIGALQSPVWCDGRRAATTLPPPDLGEHTDEQLALAGFSVEEISRLREAGII